MTNNEILNLRKRISTIDDWVHWKNCFFFGLVTSPLSVKGKKVYSL